MWAASRAPAEGNLGESKRAPLVLSLKRKEVKEVICIGGEDMVRKMSVLQFGKGEEILYPESEKLFSSEGERDDEGTPRRGTSGLPNRRGKKREVGKEGRRLVC